jgi:hypothetical protein
MPTQSITLKESLLRLYIQSRLMLCLALMAIAAILAPKWHKKPIYEAIIVTCEGVIDGTNDIDRAVVDILKKPQ